MAITAIVSAQQHDYIAIFSRHFNSIIEKGTDHYGNQTTPVWMSSLDPSTVLYPDNDSRPTDIPARVYLNRSVDAPKGATLYWDFPNLAAAIALSETTGNPKYRKAAIEYIKFYLNHCKAANGTLLYGNHYYYQAFDDQCVRFQSSEPPVAVDFNQEQGDLHEIRPFSPPWEILWAIDSVATLQYLKTITFNHMADLETGEFNRHADGKRGYAFIEQGGILVYSLAYLFQKTNDDTYLKQAQSIINYSYQHRDEVTGLIANCPTQDRWDRYTSTTEVGHWARYVLKAAELVPDPFSDSWRSVIDSVVSKWLKYGFNNAEGQFYGGLDVSSASPFKPVQEYAYQPGKHSNIWNPLFPTHDYPLQMAETCIELYRLTDKTIYKQASERWLEHIQRQVKNRDVDQLLYAENYGRIIHYLINYQETFAFSPARKLANRLAEEAVEQLYLDEFGMFRSHTGENRYDAVDGIGLLSLSLLQLQTGNTGPYHKYFF